MAIASLILFCVQLLEVSEKRWGERQKNAGAIVLQGSALGQIDFSRICSLVTQTKLDVCIGAYEWSCLFLLRLSSSTRLFLLQCLQYWWTLAWVRIAVAYHNGGHTRDHTHSNTRIGGVKRALSLTHTHTYSVTEKKKEREREVVVCTRNNGFGGSLLSSCSVWLL